MQSEVPHYPPGSRKMACKHKAQEFINGEWVIIVCPKCAGKSTKFDKKAKRAQWKADQAKYAPNKQHRRWL